MHKACFMQKKNNCAASSNICCEKLCLRISAHIHRLEIAHQDEESNSITPAPIGSLNDLSHLALFVQKAQHGSPQPVVFCWTAG